MDVNNTPIGSTVVVAENSYIKSTFTRVSQAEGLLQLYDPSTGKLVMKVNVDMNTGGQNQTWFDRDFWTVNVDGRPIPHEAGHAQGDMSWDVKSRTIDIKTR